MSDFCLAYLPLPKSHSNQLCVLRKIFQVNHIRMIKTITQLFKLIHNVLHRHLQIFFVSFVQKHPYKSKWPQQQF